MSLPLRRPSIDSDYKKMPLVIRNRPWFVGMAVILSWALLLFISSTFFPEQILSLTESRASEVHSRIHRGFDKTTRALDDTSDRIAEIVINVSREECDQVIPVIDGLLDHINPQIQLTFSCSDEYCVQAIQDRVAQEREHFPWKTDIVLTNFRLTPWARDRRIARAGPMGQERFSLVPPAKDWYGIDRRNEIRLPYLLNDLGLAPEATPLPFLLDGGNLVTDSHYAFIGGNNIEVNRAVIPNQQDLKRMLKLYLGTPVVHVFARKKQVPWHHIDMYVPPLPGKRVLVASPVLAEQILTSTGENHSIVKEKFLRLSFSRERSRLFDDVAGQFKKLNYDVTRIPAIPHYLDQWMMTYNNVLMDFRDQSSIVYLPTYGVHSLDQHAQRIYEDLGFQVRTVNVSSLYRNGGTLRCFANVTKRVPRLPSSPNKIHDRTREINIHRPGSWVHQRMNPPPSKQTPAPISGTVL